MAASHIQWEETVNLEKEILGLAKRAFRPLKYLKTLESIDDIRPEHFFHLFEIVSGETIPGWRDCKNKRQEANMCQFLINTLDDNVDTLSLDHITGEAITEGDPRALKNLLEIFCEIIEEYNRRSPLADISDKYISKKGPEASNKELKTSTDITADPGFIPPEIRKLLSRINNDAETIARYSQSSGLLDAFKSSHRIKEIFTQTTPVPMTSSVTSPITWDFILKKRNLQEAEKLQSKTVSQSKPLTRKVVPTGKTVASGTKPRGLQKSLGPKRVVKPKPVLGSKLRRSSSSAVTKSGLSPISKKSSAVSSTGDTVDLQKLVEHAEIVVSRRREMAREIKRLQNEENILKTTEMILKKEIQLLQKQKSKTPATSLQRLTARN
ncbi:uncharacterized protein LOC133202833 isoform X2 [Saccostrea echinata]|uniref:uncharacterized protein LOC133202833 isoform X2 n=1 Tax=Saccostrea echinata TaxID=191078 RepID=UPI002A82B30C|nr:uncharacterized protein LOC133202833 isoform X2 [Saccostrea echinata]